MLAEAAIPIVCALTPIQAAILGLAMNQQRREKPLISSAVCIVSTVLFITTLAFLVLYLRGKVSADLLSYMTIGLTAIIVIIAAIDYVLRQRESKKEKPVEQQVQAETNYELDDLVRHIPTLIADIDRRRGELIQIELNKRLNSGDTQFVFNILSDAWCILLGTEPPNLPPRTGEEDIGAIVSTLMRYTKNGRAGINKLTQRTKQIGELKTGLLMARVANKYLGIDDELAKDPLNEQLKSARELLPSSVAVEATKAIDNYLDYSRAYRGVDAVVIPLTKMVEDNQLLQAIPIIKQVVDAFKQYKEIYFAQMNANLAKVNEALRLL